MKAHQFQSITEHQWKSGLSRHKCALCAYDYDDPVHGYLDWPLIMTIHDCYEPPMAQIVLEAWAEYSDEACGLVVKFVAECAREHWSVN